MNSSTSFDLVFRVLRFRLINKVASPARAWLVPCCLPCYLPLYFTGHFEQAAERKEKSAALNRADELPNLFTRPACNFRTFGHVFCDLLQVAAFSKVFYFDDAELLIHQPAPLPREILHVQPSDIQQEVSVQVPTFVALCDFQRSTAPFDFLKQLEAAEFQEGLLKLSDSFPG